MYRYIIMILLAWVLSGCFWSNSSDNTADGLTSYNQSWFSLSIPQSWDIQSDVSVFPQPHTWQIELAVVSNDASASFARNLLILSDTITKLTTSTDFMISQMVSARDTYVWYTGLDTRNINFSDGEEGIVYIFEAQYNVDTPKLKFIQTAHLCQPDQMYVMTLTLPVQVRENDRYVEMLKTFWCDYSNDK